ncbi:hypothetical protein LTR10_010081 [Elasticomyces elasticus]|uniref:Zn(2)-C6 fungal-type domain-containing protein n=1 Tax=Elasticomyces elasticus TaxID=574655 RepID=A0AAN7VWJ0_9PEZI|nr:hypothetical protein LTR10_010081 [Elasticomyces elasticus]KAK4970373.1 hypothetical protein LTR42_008540 [Elasticomyces elasticus]KAK5689856.1 hypothetical protein LTR97_012616 [Elasticomyces elasticus]
MTGKKVATKSRTRSGCKTCRQRRIKCDETGPPCERCVSARRTCLGYDLFRITVGGSKTDQALVRTTELSPTARTKSCSREQSAFMSFQARSAGLTQDIFEDARLHSFFCQTAHTEPAVWHAIVALESAQTRDGGYAAKQYGKALAALRTKISTEKGNSNVSVVLLACLLFVPFELMQEGHDLARTHLHSGLELLAEVKEGRKHVMYGSSLVPEALKEAFETLDTKDSLFSMGPTKLRYESLETLLACEPSELENLEVCHRISAAAGASIRELRLHLGEHGTNMEFSVMQTKLCLGLAKWADALHALMWKSSDLATQQQIRMEMINMHLFGTPDWELAYDKQTEEFERCLALCRSYVSFSTTANGSPQIDRPATTAFSLNAGVIPALYFIALKCREPSVRHEAQGALLGTGPYREGWWEAQKAATVAATAIKMEEADIEPKCAADVPASNRLNTATVMRIWQGSKGSATMG